nr:glycosyltransferase [Clostridium botulinum]
MKKADICWFEWCDPLVAYGSKLETAKDKKIICRLHSYEAFTSYIYEVNWSNVDKVIFVAEHIKRFVLSKIFIPEEKVYVIPNGIDLSKQEFKERKKGFNIAYVGQKDINKWLEDKNYLICTSVLESQGLGIMEAMSKVIRPLIHNFVGAKEVYPEKYVWNSLDDIINIYK